jgi:oxidase EvaA
MSVSVRTLMSLLHEDFAVNTDARSVLASSRWQSLMDEGVPPFSQDKSEWARSLMKSYEGESHIAKSLLLLQKSRNSQPYTEIPNIPLFTSNHQGETLSILDDSDESNSVQFFEVKSDSREVPHWNQPLYLQKEKDKQVLLCRSSGEGMEFLIRTRREPGLVNRVEFGASFNQGDLKSKCETSSSNPIQEMIEVIRLSTTIVKLDQSDEGGRFYRNICEYSVCHTDEVLFLKWSREDLAEKGYVWVNLRTIQELCIRDGLTTNELRTLVSLLLFWL